MPNKIKKFAFPGIALTASLYYSVFFAVGAIVAYIATELVCKKLIHTGKLKMLVFNFRRWQIHIHHWLIAILIIIGIYLSSSISLSIFWSGVLIGLIFHDIYTDEKWRVDDKKWYQFVYKKPR
ncbi:MAG: hypothetical protein Q8N58_00665 [bacterium]|nr:hypothetical protein [bacterium]